MGFKVNESFLRFLTMGAIGVRAVLDHMEEIGFRPIELERYSKCNKIWATKVKRLRMPDILCVRSGTRIEVRAKSKLQIRMSDAPNNPDRRWDVGLRDNDLVSLVVCADQEGQIDSIGEPVTVRVGDLKATIDATHLGPPKSASEGSERDRTWPSWVPKYDGEVLGVTEDKIRVQYDGRKYTYSLGGKRPYVTAGDHFEGRTTILAGVLSGLAELEDALNQTWEPFVEMLSPDPVDRYAAAKALPYIGDEKQAVEILENSIDNDTDARVALEMAFSAARLGSELGYEHIRQIIWSGDQQDLKMEGILILSELADKRAAAELLEIARSAEFGEQELRQAAVWGLGKTGARNYPELLEFIADEEHEVALHAIVGFGSDTPQEVIDSLLGLLSGGNPRERAAASAALVGVGSDAVLGALIEALRESGREEPWIVATLGRLEAGAVRSTLEGDALLETLEPLLVLSDENNWLASSGAASDFAFLSAQELH